jgi:hypothetical protein
VLLTVAGLVRDRSAEGMIASKPLHRTSVSAALGEDRFKGDSRQSTVCLRI